MSHATKVAQHTAARFDPADVDDASQLAFYGLPNEPRKARHLWVDTRLPGPEFDDFRLATRFVRNRHGQAVVAEIRVFPHVAEHVDSSGDNPYPGEWAASVWGIEAGRFVRDGGMPGTLIAKGVKLKAHEKLAREATGALSHLAAAFPPSHPLFGMMQALAPFTPAKRRRRKSAAGRHEQWTRELLADAALVHDDAVSADWSGVDAVSRAYRISYDAARKVVAKAKAAGLTPPCGTGETARPMSPERRAAVEAIVGKNQAAISAGRKAIRSKRQGRARAK